MLITNDLPVSPTPQVVDPCSSQHELRSRSVDTGHSYQSATDSVRDEAILLTIYTCGVDAKGVV